MIYFVFLAAIGIGIAFVPETVASRKRHFWELSLMPRLGVPKKIRLLFVSPAVTGFVTFALLGFYAALIPNLLSESLRQTSPAVSGVVVFELFVVAAASVLLTAKLESWSAMISGLALLPGALWLLVAAQLTESMSILLVAAAFGGLAGGLGYRGSLEVINKIAPPDQRSEVVSSYLVAVYGGNSLPVIGVGLLSAIASSLTAHICFVGLITLLAGAALAVGLKGRNQER